VTFELRRDGRALRVGHRGAAALAPENTLASFEAALAHGVDAIEFDVVVGAEGLLEVAHDRGRTDAPSLDDALEFLRGHDVAAHVDLKVSGREDALVDAIRRHALVDRCVVSSFRPRSLRAIAALEPALARAFTYPEDRLGISRRRPFSLVVRGALATMRRLLPRRIATMVERAEASAATLHHALVTPAAVAACHSRGFALWAWTVNDPAVAARLEAWGADAIISDDPRIFRAASDR
jgi:glycerophosphoryl diester phosphodiesterase